MIKKYTKPEIIDLNNRVYGACDTGSNPGDDCVDGSSATGDCLSNGSSATSSCTTEGSVVSNYCTFGSNASAYCQDGDGT
jgi:hypothetical protein